MNESLSRRRFLVAATLAPATLYVDGCSVRRDEPANGRSHVFFSPAEAAFVEAATARLIPSDELGPGAVEANVPGFIDIQLAGAYGRADRWYMRGPWPHGTDAQGYQLRFTPAEIYRRSIAAIDVYCQRHHQHAFAALTGDQQDAVLHALDHNDVPIDGIPSKTFFSLLWQNTQEGFLSDPIYGGNRQFAGWRLIGFPGPRYNYTREIGQFGQPYTQPFVSLAGRHPGTDQGEG